MAGASTATLANEYQKYFSKKLLDHAVQLTVMDQWADRQPLPKEMGAKVISFFRPLASVTNTTTGLVDNVQTLTEGTPISNFTGRTLARVDCTLVQLGEASKITDILNMTQLFDALKQNIEYMSEDMALNTDALITQSLVQATTNGFTNAAGTLVGKGVTMNQASGSTTEYVTQKYANGATSFATLYNSGNTSNAVGKATVMDFVRMVTAQKIARAPSEGGFYPCVIPMEIVFDLQNDPDWIDATNMTQPENRRKGEIKSFGGARFVESSNPFKENAAGTEGQYAVTGAPTTQLFRSFCLSRRSYGIPAIAGDNPNKPKIMIVPPNKPDHADPLGQFGTAGWKAYWVAQVLNAIFLQCLSSFSSYQP